ncbi:MAG TPA: pyridoxamine 5'-phosphate oxidase [Chitinophagaceae bacterium]|jgi:pyridoxamine 5'-phosphate oxidase|nr:pyridoxamine 5'-phosphate oxidase [Chitinophagaceae bacterium]
MDEQTAGIRKEYTQKALAEADIDTDPIRQFNIWWQDAVEAKIIEVNAMTLATASADGMPSARTVLMKGFSEKGFIFFTNYDSFKGQQLSENPKACLVFFWKEIERQVRITGIVEKTGSEESDHYFQSRPKASQVGAVTSPQSQVIESRQWLDEKYKQAFEQFENTTVHRPAHWGGYIVRPVIIEFWQGRPGRLHDRIQYTLLDDGNWKIERLAP